MKYSYHKTDALPNRSYFDNIFCFVGFRKMMNTNHKWDNLLKAILSKGIPLHFVLFENLIKDPVKETRAIMKFLEKENGFIQDDLERRLLCLNQNLRGNQKRKSESKLPNNQVYTKEMKKIVNQKIRNAQSYLVAANITLNITSYLLV